MSNGTRIKQSHHPEALELLSWSAPGSGRNAFLAKVVAPNSRTCFCARTRLLDYKTFFKKIPSDVSKEKESRKGRFWNKFFLSEKNSIRWVKTFLTYLPKSGALNWVKKEPDSIMGVVLTKIIDFSKVHVYMSNLSLTKTQARRGLT